MTEYKIVVVGSGGVGKSALTIRYIQETFIEKYDPTIEDSYRKQVDIDGQAVMLDILDTAGQDEFSAMRFDYMAKGDGFIIVYSITDPRTLEDARLLHTDLLKSKQESNPTGARIPIVLAGNKSDLEQERGVTAEEGQNAARKFGAWCKFFETSAKTRTNVDEVFTELVRMISRAKDGEGDAPRSGDASAAKASEPSISGRAAPASQPVANASKKPAKKKKKSACSIL